MVLGWRVLAVAASDISIAEGMPLDLCGPGPRELATAGKPRLAVQPEHPGQLLRRPRHSSGSANATEPMPTPPPKGPRAALQRPQAAGRAA